MPSPPNDESRELNPTAAATLHPNTPKKAVSSGPGWRVSKLKIRCWRGAAALGYRGESYLFVFNPTLITH